MPTREIPSISYEHAMNGGGFEYGKKIGVTLPVLAVTGVPIDSLSGLHADNELMERQVNDSGVLSSVNTYLYAEKRAAFQKLVRPIMSSVLGERAVALEINFDTDVFSPLEDGNSPTLFAVHTQKHGSSVGLLDDAALHLDIKLPNGRADVYAGHLTLEGTAQVLGRRATIVKGVYQDKKEVEPLFERIAEVGDLHIFLRSGESTHNLAGLRRAPSATVHKFTTMTPRRTHIESSFGKRAQWMRD